MSTISLESELSTLFSLFDVNGDGAITPTEVEQVLTSMAGIISEQEAKALRQLMDSQGVVSREAFLGWAEKQPGLGTHQLLRDLFQLVDTDRNGWLNHNEPSTMVSLFITPEASIDTQELLKTLDRDGNAQISLDEFVILLEGNNRLDCSLADLKRLKKSLVQISSTARLEGISLVEVDCDLGAGKPGAGAGIELLKKCGQTPTRSAQNQ